jgi:hypothetical protein
MYRPRREWAWDETAEQQYLEKRAKLAAKGYTTDEDVCRYFAEQGAPGYEPQDIRPIMLDAIVTTPFERVIRALS